MPTSPPSPELRLEFTSDEATSRSSMAACFTIEEEIERPASADPPWLLEGGQEPSKFIVMKRLPSPEERVVTSLAHRA